MFGIKIITENEYDELKNADERHYEAHKKEQAVYEKTKNDCESLRQQLGTKMQEFNKILEKNTELLKEVKKLREFKRDTLEAMGNIELAGFHLSYCNRKCKNCDHEQHDCKKYEFGSHQYCAIRK
jgi:hypothetical protein